MPKIPMGEVLVDELSEDSIRSILDWAENNTWFDTAYVYDLHEQLDKTGSLTDIQIQSLVTIIRKFEI